MNSWSAGLGYFCEIKQLIGVDGILSEKVNSD